MEKTAPKQAQHTPEFKAWMLETRYDERSNPCGLNVTDAVTGELVCRLPDGATHINSHDWPEQSNNARLIASAPQLLADRAALADALRTLLNICEDAGANAFDLTDKGMECMLATGKDLLSRLAPQHNENEGKKD